MHPVLKLNHLDQQERKILNLLTQAGASNQTALARLTAGDISQATVSRVIARLAKAGLIEKSGVTKSALYTVNPLAALFSRPATLRPRVQYDESLFFSYKPNETRWLPLEAAEKMRESAKLTGPKLDASSYSRKIAERFIIDLSWASSALEGNTYEYLETEALIKYSEAATDREAFETTMILNHKRAITFLLENLSREAIDPSRLQRIHALLLRDLLDNSDLGKMRTHQAAIGGSSYIPATDTKMLMRDLSTLCWKAAAVKDPYEASFVLLAGLSYLQAFEDGNKRMGRLLCNVPLLADGLPPMSFITIPKTDYITGLIVFYETGDASLLGNVVANAYVQSAPTYSSSVASRRLPRGIELRMRYEIDQCIQEIVKITTTGEKIDFETYATQKFEGLRDQDREIIIESIRDVLAHLMPHNATAWGVAEEDAAAYRNIIDFAVKSQTWPYTSP